MRVGLISDTHGKLRPEVFDALAGVDRILHAGDVGSGELLDELNAIADVVAVWGNTDGFEVRTRTTEVADLMLDGHHVIVVHGDQFGSPTPEQLRAAYPEADVIVYGHTHQPLIEERDGALIVNPGAAGPARFKLKPSVAILELDGDSRTARIVEL